MRLTQFKAALQKRHLFKHIRGKTNTLHSHNRAQPTYLSSNNLVGGKSIKIIEVIKIKQETFEY